MKPQAQNAWSGGILRVAAQWFAEFRVRARTVPVRGRENGKPLEDLANSDRLNSGC